MPVLHVPRLRQLTICWRMQEIELLRSLSFDANIVQFYGACLQEENTMMVLEYMAVSNLMAPCYMHLLYVTCICHLLLLLHLYTQF